MRRRLGVLALLALAACSRHRVAPPAPCPVVVVVALPGAHAEDVEKSVVEPLEAALSTLPGLASIDSEARAGGARLRLRLSGDGGLVAVRSALEKTRAALPADAETPLVLATRARPLSIVVLRARPTEDLRALRSRADALARRLGADVLAPAETEAVLTLDPERMRALGVDLGAVLGALDQDAQRPAGAVRLQADAPRPAVGDDLALLLDAVVRAPQGAPIRVRDLATAVLRTPPLPAARLDGAPAAVLVTEGPVAAAALAGEETLVIGPLTLDDCAPAALPDVKGPAAIARLETPGAAPEALLVLAQRLATPGALVLVGGGLVSADGPGGASTGGVEVVVPAADEAGARAAAESLRRTLREPAVAASLGQAAVAAPGERRVGLTVAHPDLEKLAPAADALAAALRARPEVVEVAVETFATAPELRVDLRPGAAVRPADLALALETATRGVDTARLTIGAKRVPVRVRIGDATDDIAGVVLPGGARVGDVATVSHVLSTARIVRRDRARAAIATVTLRADADLAALRAEAERIVRDFPGVAVSGP